MGELRGPPLSYSLPAFRAGDQDQAARRLETLASLGFRHVVLHPTFTVSDGLQILDGPDPAEWARAARAFGFTVRLEPHLDYITSLTGGPYRWRRDMLLDPRSEYVARVLRPLAELQPDEFTLGSELDWSVAAFGDEWAAVAEQFRELECGHKLNHDWTSGPEGIEYLRGLDYVALSWYVPDLRPLPEGYVIGEIGLGSTDTARPWHFEASTFDTPEALAIRRSWYLERLDWLRTVRSPRAAAFWTAGHFDILGIMHPEWRDDAVVEAVCAYNQASP